MAPIEASLCAGHGRSRDRPAIAGRASSGRCFATAPICCRHSARWSSKLWRMWI